MITPPATPASQADEPTPAQDAVQATVSTQENVQESKPSLTGIDLATSRQGRRKLNVRMTLEPTDADWIFINFDVDPYYAGQVCCYTKFEAYIFYGLQCAQGYRGDVTFTTIVTPRNGPDVRESVSFTCR